MMTIINSNYVHLMIGPKQRGQWCSITGFPDTTAVAKNVPFRNPPPAGSETARVERARRIPISIGNPRKREQVSVVCAAFSRLRFESLLTEINERSGLNGLQNILCLDKELHNHFYPYNCGLSQPLPQRLRTMIRLWYLRT